MVVFVPRIATVVIHTCGPLVAHMAVIGNVVHAVFEDKV